MIPRSFWIGTIVLFLIGVLFPSSTLAANPTLYPSTVSKPIVRYGQLPLTFIENKGQLDESVSYYLQGRDKSLYFTPQGVTFVLTGPFSSAIPSDGQPQSAALTSQAPDRQEWVVKLDFVGANPKVRLSGLDLTPTQINYFKGSPQHWKSGLATYGSLVYSDLWPGIDLIYQGTADRLKYQFVVKPGADPSQIRLAYRGTTEVKLNGAGQMEVSTPLGGFADDAPRAYQDINGQRTEVSMAYALDASSRSSESRSYGFHVGSYDFHQPLILDPAILVYAGYLGGSGDEYSRDIAVDSGGNVYVTGWASAAEVEFPQVAGPGQVSSGGGTDTFLFKVNPSGTALIYGAYIGGTGNDSAYGVAVDADGNAYVEGQTDSSEATFPVTMGPDLTSNGGNDAFVAKVSADGTELLYAGFVGGSAEDYGEGIVVDDAGNVYISGSTYSSDFPVVMGPGLSNQGGPDVFVAKVNASGTGLDFSGYVGGGSYDEGNDIALDLDGNVYLFGSTGNLGSLDAFVAKVNAADASLTYYRTVGGADDDQSEAGAVDSAGRAYLVGETLSPESSFPIAIGPDLSYNGDYDSFVARVSADGTTLEYAGYIGGIARDQALGVALDGSGNLYVSGLTASTETSFPLAGELDATYNGGVYDAFLTKIDPTGATLLYSGFLGGSNDDEAWDVAVDSDGNAYLTGPTNSPESSFPVTVGPNLTYDGGFDIFAAKVSSDNDWHVVSTLNEPRFALAATAAGNNLYVLGGTNHTSCANIGQQIVERAVVNGDGSLSPWTATSSMLLPRSNHTAVAVGDRLYALGGVNDCSLSDTTDSVEWASINADGSLGAWQATSSMTTRRLYIGAVAVNGYLYAIGGDETNPTPLSTVERAAINPDGSLGQWQATNSMVSPRSSHAVAAWGSSIYALGGSSNGSDTLNSVERAEVQADGSLAPWQLVSSMSNPRYGLKAVALNGYLYALGGQNGGIFDIVERAAINSDGSLGIWEPFSSMTTPRSDHAVAVANDRIYALGGYNVEGATLILLDSVEVVEPTGSSSGDPLTITSASSLPSGVVGEPYTTSVQAEGGTAPYTWGTASMTLPPGLNLNSASGVIDGIPTAAGSYTFTVVVTDSVFVAASKTFELNVLPATEPPSGPWQLTSPLTTPRFWLGTVVSDQYLYALGGRPAPTPSNDNGFDSIERAAIQPDGTLGQWGVLTSTMTIGRYYFPTVVHNGYVYAVGGHDNFGNYLSSIERAAIAPDGTLGPWQVISNMTKGRYSHAAVVGGDYVYAIGGYTGTWDNTVERAEINADGSLGPWQLTTSMNSSHAALAAVYWNGYLYALGGHDPNWLNHVERAEVNADGSLGTWQAETSMTTARSDPGAVVINGYLYAIGGYDGSNLSSVERAIINANGSLGVWELVPAMTISRSGLVAASTSTHIYAIGGNDGNGNTLASVEMLAVENESSLTNLVVNGSFEEPIVPGGDITILYAGASFAGWVVQEGSIDVVSPQFWDADDGNQSIDLTGNCQVGVIYQDITTVPSQSYRLAFAMSGNPEGELIKEMQVLWDSTLVAQPTFDITETDYHDMRWVHYEYTVMASATTTRLTFRSLTSGCQGAALDSVRVEPVSQAPAPTITTGSPLPDGTVGEPYTVTLAATGGVAPYAWGIASASLAPGLTMEPASGVIHGTPTAAGSYTFTVVLTDSVSTVTIKQFALSIAPEPQVFTDVGISATDIQFVPVVPQPGEVTNIKATVRNFGLTGATTVQIDFLDFSSPLGQTSIANLAPGASVEVTITATFTDASLRLISVKIDPQNTIAEVNEGNNEASKVLQVGQPDPSQADLVIQASSPTTCQGAAVAINGNAYYDFVDIPGQSDHPVQGGSVKVTILDPTSGNVISLFSGAHTDANGSYSQVVIAPLVDSAYSVHVEVTDKTLTREVETTLTVSGTCPQPPVVPPPPPPSSEPNPGTPPPSGPLLPDVYVLAEDIYFSNNHPNPGESIQLFAYVHYYGSESVTEIPVTLYDIVAVNGALVKLPIGMAQVSFQRGGDGPAVVTMPWTANPAGAHVIQVVVGPNFAQATHNDEATRLLLVGDIPQIELSKSVALLLDADGNGAASPGDTLQYTITVQNSDTPVTNVVILDDFAQNVTETPTEISNGGVVSNGVILWDLGTLNANASATVSYQVALRPLSQFPSGSTVVHNIALLTANQTPAVAASADITVNVNLSPIIDVSDDQTVAEGSSITLTASAHDPDGDPILYSWDLDNDSIYESTGQIVTFSAATRDGPESQTVMVQVCDNENTCVSAEATVNITNVPPVISTVTNSGPIAVGESVAVTITASDPAGANDPLSYAFDCDNDSTYEVGPQAASVANCAFTSVGIFTVNVQVSDGDGGEESASTTIIVRPLTAALMQDSFLRSGDSNTNEGANLNMVVRSSGHTRAVLSFTVSELVPFADTIDTVTLRLYVVYNGNNWGNTGRTIDAHQVNTLWQEGDGANVQPGNLTNAQFNPYQNRGDGPGVTWKCAVDTEIHNQQTNCNPQWNGGTYDPTPSDTVMIYKDFSGNSTLPPTTKTSGWIEFDVTEDVIECITNNATQCSWLIKKTLEGQEGLVEFATREGAQAYYDALVGAPVAPRLEVTYHVGGASAVQPTHIFMPSLSR